MSRYSISHTWNEDPDYESFAASMLDLLLHLESEGRLDDVLGPLDDAPAPPGEEAA